MRREQELPHGLRGFLADLYSAGAAVDFSVIYPGGRLVDAPLPAWSHRTLMLSRSGQESRARGAHTVPVHPLMGAHVRLHEEPERHVWQGEVGTAAHALAGRPPDPQCGCSSGSRLLRDGACRGSHGPRRGIRGPRHPFRGNASAGRGDPGVRRRVGDLAGRRRLRGGDLRDGAQTRRATAVLHAGEPTTTSRRRTTYPPCSRPTRARWMGPRCGKQFDEHGLQYGPAFAGLAAVHTADDTVGTVLAEVRLPGPIRSQQGAYGVHPALLDACFQSVAAHPDAQVAGSAGLLLPLRVRRIRSYASARTARYCYHEGDQCRRGRVGGRPRCARRARDGPAGRARTATRHRGLR